MPAENRSELISHGETTTSFLFGVVLFTEFAVENKYNVHKSKKTLDGEWINNKKDFIVMIKLPTGIISQQYDMSWWDIISVHETDNLLFNLTTTHNSDIFQSYLEYVNFYMYSEPSS